MILIQAVLVGLAGWPSAPDSPPASRPAPPARPQFYSAALNRLIDDPNWVPLPEILPALKGPGARGPGTRDKDREHPPLGSSFMPWLGEGTSSESGTSSSYSSNSRSSRLDRDSSLRSSRSSRDSSSRSGRSTRESSRSRREQTAQYGGYGSDDAGRKVRTVRNKTTRRDDGS